MGHRCFSAAITTFPESRDKKMDEIGMLGIIAAAAWLNKRHCRDRCKMFYILPLEVMEGMGHRCFGAAITTFLESEEK